MAVVNLAVNIDDLDVERVLHGVRVAWSIPEADGAQATERLRQEVIGLIKGIVKEVERNEALAAAVALDPQVNIT